MEKVLIPAYSGSGVDAAVWGDPSDPTGEARGVQSYGAMCSTHHSNGDPNKRERTENLKIIGIMMGAHPRTSCRKLFKK